MHFKDALNVEMEDSSPNFSANDTYIEGKVYIIYISILHNDFHFKQPTSCADIV